jgi:ligand-binding SRPBCC domain-containing protein
VQPEMFIQRTRIPASAEHVFAWHAEPEALARLTPPWERVRVVERTGGLEPGARVVLEMSRGPLRLRWVAEHTAWVPGREFTDVQRSGPFAFWEHTHRFVPDGAAACWLEDEVHYRLRGGRVAHWLAGWYVRRKLRRLFAFRHQVTRSAFPLLE